MRKFYFKGPSQGFRGEVSSVSTMCFVVDVQRMFFLFGVSGGSCVFLYCLLVFAVTLTFYIY